VPKTAIVFGITADHAFAAGTVLASILAHDPAFDADVVIFHDDLPADQKNAFLRLWPRCSFREFRPDRIRAVLGLTPEDRRLRHFLARYSPLVMAKLDLPSLLDDYQKVVWLDADLLVRGPLHKIWAFDCLAWRPLPAGAFARRGAALAAFADRSLDPEVPLLNGGVVGVARGFLERGGSAQALHEIAGLLVRRAPAHQLDEMPWYLLAASLGLPVTRLPMGLNHPVGKDRTEKAVVVHAIGERKFWNTAQLQRQFPDWLGHQARWVANGGAPYAGPLLEGDDHLPE
jgi:hypothetical protein